MILYKFKNLEPFVHITDLLLTKRLYCPKPEELNDPLEGVLGMAASASQEQPTSEKPFERSVRFWLASQETLNKYRVCCFSGTPKSLPMWSYYGNGHSGICLEIDVTAYEDALFKVEYLDNLASVAAATPKDLLRYKLREWAHEEEYRLILAPDVPHKYILVEIKAVLIGAAIKKDYIRPIFELCRLMKYPKEIVSFSTSGEFMRIPLNSEVPWDT
jgi:hypothetical protein